MKKTLMVVCFALCGTLAFAQTVRTAAGDDRNTASRRNTVSLDPSQQPAQKPMVGYNASIFTKAAKPVAENVLMHCEFNSASGATGSNGSATYSVGNVQATEKLDGDYPSKHSSTKTATSWSRINWTDSTDLKQKPWTNTWPALFNYFAYSGGLWYQIYGLFDTTSTGRDGMMLLSSIDQDQVGTYCINSYIEFRDKINVAGIDNIDIEMYQYYCKYYDQCFVDYSVTDGEWFSMEINVTNVDVIVNGDIYGKSTYSLPMRAVTMAHNATGGNKDKLKLRIRFYSKPTTNQASYGYWWMLDDVRVLEGQPSRLNRRPQYYSEGGYQIYPKGLVTPFFWNCQISNTGVEDEYNATASIWNYKSGDEAVKVGEYDNGSIYVFNQQSDVKYVMVDPAGYHTDDQNRDADGWHCLATDEKMADPQLQNHFTTDEVGDYFVYAQVTTNSGLDYKFDTIYYSVSDYEESVKGYVWSRDNGVISGQRAFRYGFTDDKKYVTSNSKNYAAEGYEVELRYTTGDVIPTDEDNNPFVIRGVELIPATYARYRYDNSVISPVLMYDACNDENKNTVSFKPMNTGAGSYTVDSNNIGREFNEDELLGNFGYLTRDQYTSEGNYKPIFLEFPEQPELEANVSYRIGYRLEELGYFAVATSSEDYYFQYKENTKDTLKYHFYNREEDQKNVGDGKYASRFAKEGRIDNWYDVRVYDPVAKDNCWAGTYLGSYPMIHMIIGPRVEKDTFHINFECENDGELGLVYLDNDGSTNMCGETTEVSESSTHYIYAEPSDEGAVKSITIDDQEIYNSQNGASISYENDNVKVNSISDGIFEIVFSNITDDHSVSVAFEEYTEGIDGIKSRVSMSLQPNPAINQVRMEVKGMTGLMDCALIDMSGREVYSSKMSAEGSHTISLAGLSKGVYFVRVSNEKLTKVEKLIVR